MSSGELASIDGRRARRDRNRETVVDAILSLYQEGNVSPSLDEIADPDGVERGLEFGVVGVRSSEGDVVAHDTGEQEGLLGHDPQLAPQAVDGDLAQVVPVDAHRAQVGVMKAGKETGDGRLAAAGLADERHGLARLDAE